MKIIRMDSHMSDFGPATDVDLDRVIDDLMETYRICHQTTAYCIDQGGDLATLARLRMFDDCAEINLTLANFLLRGSEHASGLASLCLAISEACADSIRDIEHGDGQLRVAYAACQRSRHSASELLGREDIEEEEKQDERSQESFPASDPPGTMGA